MARVESFRAYWCEQSGGVLEMVATSESGAGQVEVNTNADLKMGGKLRVHDVPEWVNPLIHRVKVEALIDGVPMPLGVFCVEEQSVAYGKGSRVSELTLLDQLFVPRNDLLLGPYAVGAGANIVSEAVKVLEATGEKRIAVTKSTAVLQTPLVWEPGVSRLQVINDLLAAAGYWGLRTNPVGDFEIKPYVLPEARPVVHEFIAGEASLMLPDYEVSTNHGNIPNRFVAWCPQYDDKDPDSTKFEGLVGVAELTNRDSPFSYVNRGRWVAQAEQVEAASQKEIDAIAQAKLSALVQPSASVEATHALIPGLWVDDVVYASPSQGEGFKAAVVKMGVSLKPGGLVKASWKQVVSLV